jgi:DNA-binding transcriptional ArsR family regulator
MLDCSAGAGILKHMLDHSAVLDHVFSALSDPSRRTMVERLGKGPASVSELAEPLDMSLAAVVQHVQMLTESGVIRTEKTGRVRTCRLNDKVLGVAAKWIVARQEAFWKAGLEAMDGLLKAEDKRRARKERKR